MSNYLVRVELHGANYAHYEQLHKAMAAKGFLRTIVADSGVGYSLPTAEYTMSTSQNGTAVRQMADSAADTTGLRHGVLAVAYEGAWWTGLPQA